jgi:hypothetical protein
VHESEHQADFKYGEGAGMKRCYGLRSLFREGLREGSYKSTV